MASKEYWDGRLMENNDKLHEYLKTALGFERIEVDGGTGTKGDTFGIQGQDRVPISVKNASGVNTQVHLTTLSKLAQDLGMPQDVQATMDRWLGTRDDKEFETWRQGLSLSHYELTHNRIKSQHIPNWSDVENWVNEKNKDLSLPNLLIQSLNKENPVKFLAWINKKKGGLQIVDVNKLVQWIGSDCRWITMKSGTVLRCITPDGKPILWLQMKGNKKSYGYNHCPQFHIESKWPRDLIVHENTSIRF